MAAYLSTLITDLRAVVAATWTDVKANGIWVGQYVEKVPWESLTPPYAVIAMGDAEEDDGTYSSSDSLAYIVQPRIAWVGKATGDAAAQRAKAEALRDALKTGTLTAGQIIRIPEVSWSDRNAVNEIMAGKNYDYRAGLVVPTFVIGETW